MNQNLSTIYELLQQNPQLSEDEKKILLKALTDADKQWSITDFKLDRTEKVKKTTAILLEETIAELEQKRKAVEEQNKELEIESSLERVRSRTMGMHHSDDLSDVIKVITEQLGHLGIKYDSASFAYIFEDRSWDLWVTTANQHYPVKIYVPYLDHKIFRILVDSRELGNDFISYTLTQDEKNTFFQHFFEHTSASVIPEERKQYVYNTTGFASSVALLDKLSLSIINYEGKPYIDHENNIIRRLGKVFEQSYTRFLDLQKAEAQAREAKIEAALERVRARTMAMHNSDELSAVLSVLFDQFDVLEISPMYTFLSFIDLEKNHFTYRQTGRGGKRVIAQQDIDLDASELWKDTLERWKAANYDVIETMYTPKDSVAEVFRIFDGIYSALPEGAKVYPDDFPEGIYTAIAASKFGHLGYDHHRPSTEEEKSILFRFNTEFVRLYQRFLDLKKAEAQAREAKIEAALERTRTQSMLMQHSNELDITSRVFHEQLLLLGIKSEFSYVWLPDVEKGKHLFWGTWNEEQNGSNVSQSRDATFDLDKTEPYTAECFRAWQSNEPVHVYPIAPTEVKPFFDIWGEIIGDAKKLKPEFFPEGLYYAEAFMKYGCFGIYIRRLLTEDEKKILLRFTIEFERTFTRFLDLQKAEAQAREAQTEAALERVRSRSMAMQKSEELKDVIQVVYEQFVHLNIHIEHTGFIMDYRARDDMHIWLADKHEVPSQVTIPYFDCAHWNSFNEAKGKGIDFFANHLGFEEKNRFYQDLFKLIPGVPAETLEYYYSVPGLAISTVLLENVGLYIENFAGTPYSAEENNTLMRFGKVFQQTYTRFLDLQKAEAQARESKIEAALEKVRSRSLAMHKSDELEEVIMVVSEQLLQLQFRFHNVSFSSTNEQRETTFWLGTPGKPHPYLIHLPYIETIMLTRVFEAREKGVDFFADTLTAEQNQEWLQHLVYNSRNSFTEEDKKYLLTLKGLARSTVLTKHIILAIINYAIVPYTEEQNFILKRFGKVFEQAYTRFLDLKKAEAQARESQIEASLERVRSRTMAMQRSDELANVATVLFQQVKALDVQQWTCGFSIFEIDDKEFTWYQGSGDGDILPPVKIPLTEHPVFISFNESRRRGDELFVYEKEGEFQADHYRYMRSLPGGEEMYQNI